MAEPSFSLEITKIVLDKGILAIIIAIVGYLISLKLEDLRAVPKIQFNYSVKF